MRTDGRFSKRLPLLVLPLSLAVLNFALSFHNLWPTLWITLRPELSIEIVVFVLALALYMERRGPPSRNALRCVSAVVFLFALARYAEVTAPALYGRAVNLYWDLPRVPDVMVMLVQAAPAWLILLGGLGLVALLLLAFTLIALSLATTVRAFTAPLPRRATGSMMLVLIALFVAGHSSLPVHSLSWYSLPLTVTYKKQIEFVAEALAAAPIEPGVTSLHEDYDLGALARGDVVFAFIESYGAVVFDEPSVRSATQAGRDEFATALAATDYEVVSAMVRSPTFGGVSWLAHSSFMAGLEVTDNGQYNLLLTHDINTLPAIFQRHAYRSVAVMPGMKRAWPEGAAFYGFDRILGEQALDYKGPEFGWWRIPDQFALARLHELELGSAEGPPVAAFFQSINTHLPFQPLPPLQNDWQALLTDQPFSAPAVARSLAEAPDWNNLRPAYSAAIDYSYRYWAGYLSRPVERPVVIVLLGDHQPPANVSGQGARWDVPVHVISNKPAIMRHLRTAGFITGLVPAPGFIGPMHQLVDTLMSSFSAVEHRGQGEDQGTAGGNGEQNQQNGP